MDDNSGSKLTGIRQIVRLKEILRKWQSLTVGSKETSLPSPPSDQSPCGIPPAINKRLNSVTCCDSDEESCHSPEPAWRTIQKTMKMKALLKMLLLLKSNRTGLFGPDFRTDSGSKAGGCPCRHV
ncbi:hypothetical protein H0E87_029706 [Populus deltoides]|uniref:Uncharacterized protein n=1 Tax=Populus deltoides TaxID=3696 RepID=A0A8T2WRM2_POPDE|nr:hypothetical protein H0E87_029706 [Populus deltoides]